MSNNTILVVDDNPENLDVLIALLRGADYQVRPANSGKMALTTLRHNSADLILLDILMPEMDGYEVCRNLKENPATRDIPVIFLSALSEPLDKIEAFKCGGVDYISKPFSAEEVLARVNTHVQLYALQQRMARRNEELEELVAHRTSDLLKSNAALRETNAALEKALRIKDEFLSMISHEFRTPLNGVLGIAQILRQLSPNGVPEHLLKLLESSGWRLLKLVDDILQLARTGATNAANESGEAAVEIDVVALCAESLKVIASALQEKGISGELTLTEANKNLPLLEIPLTVSRFNQILGNLLDNALKFTPENGHLGIRLSYMSEYQKLYVEVWDSGPGIPQEERERIFAPFLQLEPILTRSHEGCGLGLTLARNLLMLHGGEIKVKDGGNGGACVEFSLPARPVESI